MRSAPPLWPTQSAVFNRGLSSNRPANNNLPLFFVSQMMQALPSFLAAAAPSFPGVTLPLAPTSFYPPLAWTKSSSTRGPTSPSASKPAAPSRNCSPRSLNAASALRLILSGLRKPPSAAFSRQRTVVRCASASAHYATRSLASLSLFLMALSPPAAARSLKMLQATIFPNSLQAL